jgi:catechol 2,3-dioxygenase-like lactoylglutathione lyase family enzyme
MNPHVSAITLGVRDVDRAKRFYSDGLGWPIHQDQGESSASVRPTARLRWRSTGGTRSPTTPA